MCITSTLSEGNSNSGDTERFIEKKTQRQTKQEIGVAFSFSYVALHLTKQERQTGKSHTPISKSVVFRWNKVYVNGTFNNEI